ncbi:MAG: hypothetical protein IPM53_17395 [Anaerolineaceae bacterium]|nr:hypothetical protein [Anaerolineaceae bacterium]
MDESLKEYRTFLINADQKAQEDFDKTILTLSGGALGISIAFVKDVIGGNPIEYAWALAWAWISWSVSLTCILTSFYLSQQALRKSIRQVDSGEIYQETPGGRFSKFTSYANGLGIIFFILGVLLIVLFAYRNLVL